MSDEHKRRSTSERRADDIMQRNGIDVLRVGGKYDG